MKRAGFTMIELIFVLVILGILTSIAIPKLAATRTDAQVAKMSSNLSTVLKDIGAKYTATGTLSGKWNAITNVGLTKSNGESLDANQTFQTGIAVYLSAGESIEKICFSIAATTDGNVSITSLAAGTDPACIATRAVAIKNNIIDATVGTPKVHQFAGTGISY